MEKILGHFVRGGGERGMTQQKKRVKMISSAEVAAIVGKTDRTVQSLAKQGELTCEKDGTKNTYNLYTVIQEYLRYEAKLNTRDISSLEIQKNQEDVRMKRAKASMAELDLAEYEGNMHRSEDVESVMNDLIFTIRSMILALPGRLAIDVMEAETAAEASDIIRKECYFILDELSRYRYDPEEYRKKVRERAGHGEGFMDDRDN